MDHPRNQRPEKPSVGHRSLQSSSVTPGPIWPRCLRLAGAPPRRFLSCCRRSDTNTLTPPDRLRGHRQTGHKPSKLASPDTLPTCFASTSVPKRVLGSVLLRRNGAGHIWSSIALAFLMVIRCSAPSGSLLCVPVVNSTIRKGKPRSRNSCNLSYCYDHDGVTRGRQHSFGLDGTFSLARRESGLICYNSS